MHRRRATQRVYARLGEWVDCMHEWSAEREHARVQCARMLFTDTVMLIMYIS